MQMATLNNSLGSPERVGYQMKTLAPSVCPLQLVPKVWMQLYWLERGRLSYWRFCVLTFGTDRIVS